MAITDGEQPEWTFGRKHDEQRKLEGRTGGFSPGADVFDALEAVVDPKTVVFTDWVAEAMSDARHRVEGIGVLITKKWLVVCAFTGVPNEQMYVMNSPPGKITTRFIPLGAVSGMVAKSFSGETERSILDAGSVDVLSGVEAVVSLPLRKIYKHGAEYVRHLQESLSLDVNGDH